MDLLLTDFITRQSLTQVWFDDIDADTLEAAEQGRPYVSGTDQPQTAVNPRPLVTGNCKEYVFLPDFMFDYYITSSCYLYHICCLSTHSRSAYLLASCLSVGVCHVLYPFSFQKQTQRFSNIFYPVLQATHSSI